MSPNIPDDVRRFVLAFIPSIPFMEAALLFHESPDVVRSSQQVASTIYVSESVASSIVQGLCELGLLAAVKEGFVYAPRDHAIADVFDRTAAVYRQDLIGVTRLIHDQTQRNATRFAEAFRFRRTT